MFSRHSEVLKMSAVAVHNGNSPGFQYAEGTSTTLIDDTYFLII